MKKSGILGRSWGNVTITLGEIKSVDIGGKICCFISTKRLKNPRMRSQSVTLGRVLRIIDAGADYNRRSSERVAMLINIQVRNKRQRNRKNNLSFRRRFKICRSIRNIQREGVDAIPFYVCKIISRVPGVPKSIEIRFFKSRFLANENEESWPSRRSA